MKRVLLLVVAATMATAGFAQKKTTTSASVSFDATTPKDEYPKAENKAVIASLNTTTGELAFEATVKNFAFANAKIQDHFNDKGWLNSDEFPKFVFKGKINKVSKINFAVDGTYKTIVKGNLTVKGVTKSITVRAEFAVKDGKINATSSFTIVLADFGVQGAAIEGGKVAAEPKIKVAATF